MGTILIGNIKGPQGSQGIQGPQGPVGPVGPTGPGADIYNGLDQTEAGVAGLDSYQGRVLDQKKLDVAKVANNLTTAGDGYALDARQGKALDEKKLDVGRVANNLTTEASGYALDARQGKALNDANAEIKNLFYKGNEQFQLLYFANKGWDSIFAESPAGSVSIVRAFGQNQYPFASNNYIALQWRSVGEGAYGTQLVFGFGGTPAYRNCVKNTWSAWKNLA